MYKSPTAGGTFLHKLADNYRITCNTNIIFMRIKLAHMPNARIARSRSLTLTTHAQRWQIFDVKKNSENCCVWNGRNVNTCETQPNFPNFTILSHLVETRREREPPLPSPARLHDFVSADAVWTVGQCSRAKSKRAGWARERVVATPRTPMLLPCENMRNKRAYNDLLFGCLLSLLLDSNSLCSSHAFWVFFFFCKIPTLH